MDEGFRQSEVPKSSAVERSRSAWGEKGPNALKKFREEGFFDQFGIDTNDACTLILEYCTGRIDVETVNDFFDRNSESKLVGQTFGEGENSYTVTCVGHNAKQEIFDRLEEETGQTWWEE